MDLEIQNTSVNIQKELVQNRDETKTLLTELAVFLNTLEQRVNYVKDACEMANVDESLKTLVNMLREAATILLAKAKAKLLVMEKLPNPNDSYVPALHVSLSLAHVKLAYERLDDMLIVLERVKSQKDESAAAEKGGQKLSMWSKMQASALMAAADDFLGEGMWRALKPLWHSVAIHLCRGDSATHFGIRCDSCNAIPIKGTRYHAAGFKAPRGEVAGTSTATKADLCRPSN